MPRGITRQEVKPNSERVRFSFEFLQLDHPRFLQQDCTKEFYDALFAEILRYQGWSWDAFRDMPNEDRRHPITWSETEEKGGFAGVNPQDEELWTDEAWQFGLPGTRGTPSWGWRVHGFIAENIFHIVWLDPCHQLDSPVNQHPSTVGVE